MRRTLLLVICFLLVILFAVSKFLSGNELSKEHYYLAKEAILKYKPLCNDKVIIIDYRKNLFARRLYVIDMLHRKVLISSTVSHAWNTGFLWPNLWSNVPGSEKSSKGVFLTQEVYQGKFGKSMRLRGLDKGVNNNARSRAIVVHSTPFYLPFWSKGCFVTDPTTNNLIIDLTANGTLLCVIN